MPSMQASRVDLPADRYRRMPNAVSNPQSFHVQNAPELPTVIRRSTVMISSLPSIATDVDGVARQFYGGQKVPTRRLMLP